MGARAVVLAACVLLVGCIPTRWPTRPDAGPDAQPKTQPAPPPIAASSPRPRVVAPAQTPATAPATAPAKAARSDTDSPAPAPVPRAGNPPFYEVFGERYFVMPSSDGYREQGVASWYGAQFHGRRTSSGAVYNMHALTAAHKTLPLPSVVRVTNIDTGESVVVTVNDRGPFVKDRLIDLSYAAANALGLVKSGTGAVEVEAIGSAPESPREVTAQRLFLQVGAFSDEVNAARLKTDLESNGVNGVVIRYDDGVFPALYRVRIGPLEGSGAYDDVALRVAALGIASPRLVTEPPSNP